LELQQIRLRLQELLLEPVPVLEPELEPVPVLELLPEPELLLLELELLPEPELLLQRRHL